VLKKTRIMIESECLYYGSATYILHSLIIIKKLKKIFSIKKNLD